jgi:hypothetical protein
MSWARLDDAILDNAKIIAAGPLGFALHVAAITWCARNLTDGLIPKLRVRTLVCLDGIGTALAAPPACGPEEDRFLPLDADEIATELATIGLWHDRGAYWELHDYLVYNPPREKVLADRERARSKKAKQRLSRGESPGDTEGDMHDCPPGSPDAVPVYPVPVPVPGSEQKKLAFARKEKSAPPRAKAKTPWPHDFALTETRAAYATRQGLDARYEWGKFQAHALRDDVRHADWVRAWEYWVRNAWELERRRG